MASVSSARGRRKKEIQRLTNPPARVKRPRRKKRPAFPPPEGGGNDEKWLHTYCTAVRPQTTRRAVSLQAAMQAGTAWRHPIPQDLVLGRWGGFERLWGTRPACPYLLSLELGSVGGGTREGCSRGDPHTHPLTHWLVRWGEGGGVRTGLLGGGRRLARPPAPPPSQASCSHPSIWYRARRL